MRTITLRRLACLTAFWCCLGLALAQQNQPLRVMWGPVLSDVTSTSARLAWATNRPARGRVLSEGVEWRSAGSGIYHQVQLTGLAPGREYEYLVQVRAGHEQAQSDHYVFRTPPLGLSNWSFLVFGDTRSNHDDHRAVVRAMLRVLPRPWLILHTGDLVADGRMQDQWTVFFEIEKPLLGTIPYYPCLGNHEHESGYYYDFWPLPAGGGPQGKAWYRFELGGAVFIVLNSERQLEEQRNFLAQELARAEQERIRWRFLCWHRPPYSSGSHGGAPDIQQKWVPIIERYGATAVFCGHDHAYEHSVKNGVHYVTSGGGGAPRYPVGVKPNPYALKAAAVLHFLQVQVSPMSVGIRAIRPDGRLLDEFSIP
jgi:hypothetical protein